MAINQRQIIAVLTVLGSVTALGFAIYNLWAAFQPNNGTPLAARNK